MKQILKKNVYFEKIFLNLKSINNKFQKIPFSIKSSTFRKNILLIKKFFENTKYLFLNIKTYFLKN